MAKNTAAKTPVRITVVKRLLIIYFLLGNKSHNVPVEWFR
ncbi:hypothetical protein VCRA2112O188_30008 [Vibrio crassostreae]|nr:hypothetical protein VCRA2113O213_20008 [Vibrio crassostreae]CAK1986205.1 hypothetical protein VCRA2110O178_20008 [Vibrio crassostreae]CAK1986617.1 hypothetical protein VCRA2110O180_20008 [Vibrio crassostreae]CAK1986655.1 hypothetical protein VCRA2113O198_20008 [Vibrio crassostreae]CAK1992757.1 hypothetical protein VCRA2113O201_20008 [Vibrio crassostreae]